MAMRRATASTRPSVATNAFIGKSQPPTDQQLSAVLGPAKALWDQVLTELADELRISGCDWHSYSLKAGWSLRVRHGDRVILYLAPVQGSFRASFALGDKAVQAALASGLPQPVMEIIRGAKKYAEGTAVRIDVNGEADIEVVKKLAKAKIETGSSSDG
jgi:hypothetical protein